MKNFTVHIVIAALAALCLAGTALAAEGTAPTHRPVPGAIIEGHELRLAGAYQKSGISTIDNRPPAASSSSTSAAPKPAPTPPPPPPPPPKDPPKPPPKDPAPEDGVDPEEDNDDEEDRDKDSPIDDLFMNAF